MRIVERRGDRHQPASRLERCAHLAEERQSILVGVVRDLLEIDGQALKLVRFDERHDFFEPFAPLCGVG